MRLLIEVESADEFVELLQELEWQSRNGKLDDTLDGYQAAYAAITETECERCAEICAEVRRTALRQTTGDMAHANGIAVGAEFCERKIRGEK